MAETATQAYRTAEKLARVHDKVSVRQLQLYAGLYANVLRLAHRELDAPDAERAMQQTRAELSALDTATADECRTLLLKLQRDAQRLVQQLAPRQPVRTRASAIPWQLLYAVVVGMIVLGALGAKMVGREHTALRAAQAPSGARVSMLAHSARLSPAAGAPRPSATK